MYCEICGCILDEHATVCPVCGTKVGSNPGNVNIQHDTENQSSMNMIQPSGNINLNNMVPPNGNTNLDNMTPPSGNINPNNMIPPNGSKKPKKDKSEHTSGTKTAIVIVAVVFVVLICVTAGSIIVFKNKKNSEDSSAVSTEQENTSDKTAISENNSESSTEDTSEKTDEITGQVAEDKESSTEAMAAGEDDNLVTENSVTETTDKTDDSSTGSASEVVDEGYKDAYKEILKDNKEGILDYDWQFRGTWDGDEYIESEDVRPVSLVDITGDNIPELFITVANENYTANLLVYTYKDGEAVKMYDDCVDVDAASGTSYFIFQIEGSDDIYEYSGIGDEGYDYHYNQYTRENDELVLKHQWIKSEWPNEDYTDTEVICSLDDEEITQSEYEDKVNELHSQISRIIIYNSQGQYAMEDADIKADRLSETFDEVYDEMGEKTQTQGGGATSINVELPDDLPESFVFTSGVGAWATVVTIHQDGTFEGTYHDSDMGDWGEDYEGGTVYLCSFAGKFTNIQEVDDYTYSMEIEYIDMDEEPGVEWIEDSVRYISSEPYGLDDPTIFYLYLPGATMADLPEEFVNWISMPYGWSTEDIPKTLPFYGLYNVNMQEGFLS